MPARTSCGPACGSRCPAPRSGSCARRGAPCPSTGRRGARAPSWPPSATPRCRPSSPCSRSAATASTPPSCSPTSSSRSTPSASGSTSSRAGARWSPSRSAARPTWTGSGRFEPATDAPYVAETVGLVRRGAGGIGRGADRVRRRAVHRGQLPVEGGPSRTFAKVKALMHGKPGLWEQLTDRLAAMAVASLRAQIEAGAQAVQLFDSWAGLALARRVRPLRPPRHPRRPRRASPTSASPTILFGVGTGELLGAHGLGRSRRRRRRLAGPPRRGPPARRPGLRAAGQPRPGALPGPVARRRGCRPRRCSPRRGRRHRHRPRLQPGPWRAARDGPGHPGRRRRTGPRRDRRA